MQGPVLALGLSPRDRKSLDNLEDQGAAFRPRSNSLGNMVDVAERRKKFSTQLDISEPQSPTKRRGKVTVTVRVVFLKIGEIETIKECFSAEAFVQAKWREPALDGLVNSSRTEEVQWNNYWNPKLSIVNSIGEPKENVWYSLMFNAQKEALICERRRIKGTFLENLELGEFPFDTQDISLSIMSERSSDEVELEEDIEMSSINIQSFVDEQEWNLYKHVITTTKTIERVYQASTDKHAIMSFTCRASRRVGFFLWNIFFVMFFICSMTFTTFGVTFTLIQNRLQLTFILLLTTVTFKFTVNQSLPKISYLTYLDYYVLASMVTICLICIWHGIVGSILTAKVDNKTVYWVDIWILVVFISVYIGGHFALLLFILLVVLRRRKQDKEKERQYFERKQNLTELQRSFLLDLGNNMK